MTKKLSQDQIHQVHHLVIRARLDRDDLLGGFDRAFALSLRVSPSPSGQILSDLDDLNGMEPLTDGTVPLVAWLRKAIHLAGVRAEARELKKILTEVLESTDPNSPDDPDRVPAIAQGPTEESILRKHPFPWRHRSAIKLRNVLVHAYSDIPSAQHLARTAGVDLGSWNNQHGIEPAWNSLLEIAAAQAKLDELIAVVLHDPKVTSYHRIIRDLL